MLKILVGVSMIALAVPAFAQKVYDNNNTLIGPLVITGGPVVSGPGPERALPFSPGKIRMSWGPNHTARRVTS